MHSWPGGGGIYLLRFALLLKIPIYIAFIAVLMTYLDSLAGTLILFVLTSAVPMSFSVLLGKPNGGDTVNTLMSGLAYLFAPITATKYEPLLSIGNSTGYSLAIILSILLILWAYTAFSRREFVP